MPPEQYLGAERVLETLGAHGAQRVTVLSVGQVLALAVIAGGLITAGALFSLLLGASVEATGPQRLLEGLGFSTGFFFVILVSAILFTEANVTMPSVALACEKPARDLARFWGARSSASTSRCSSRSPWSSRPTSSTRRPTWATSRSPSGWATAQAGTSPSGGTSSRPGSNLLGGSLFVALPLWYALRVRARRERPS